MFYCHMLWFTVIFSHLIHVFLTKLEEYLNTQDIFKNCSLEDKVTPTTSATLFRYLA